jgi:hypothetical protein
MAVLVAGCAPLQKPFQTAETPQQKAYALYGTFVAVEEQVAEVVSTNEIDEDILQVIKQADLIAKLTADTMLETARKLNTLEKNAFLNDGEISDEEFAVIHEQRIKLGQLMKDVQSAIKNLALTIEGF